MAQDRYLVGNQIVSSPSKDDTKTIEEYSFEYKRISNECKHLRAEKESLHNLILDKDAQIKAFKEIISKLRNELEKIKKH